MVTDYLSTVIAMLLFNISRYYIVEEINSTYSSPGHFISSTGVISGLIFFPLIMMVVYAVSGTYDNPIQRSRLKELTSSISAAAIGTLLFFFIALINDYIAHTSTSYEILLVLMAILAICIYIPRAILTDSSSRRIRSGEWGFNTLIVGTSDEAVEIARQLSSRYRSMALKVVGFVDPSGGDPATENETLPLPVYPLEQIGQAIETLNVQKLIVAPAKKDSKRDTFALINRLFPLDLTIFITPDFFQLIAMRPRLSNVDALPLVDISNANLSPMTLNVKRLSDIVISATALVLLSPVLLAIAIAVKRDSPGGVFYRQQRVGYHKRLFNIIKFRTMKVDAEPDGPALSSEDDPRVTRVGHFLRKYRLDELPNFWNVLRGDMSLVGPRPERDFFIRQITEKAPYYTMVHQVRPGITSWGMVQYGYAKTVDGMVERLKYDIIYLENISLLIDMKILIHTVKTVLSGRGM